MDTWQIERHEVLASTSDRMLERIRAGEARARDVIVAAAQTAGRGRQGRAWVSEPGGLWLTAALPAGQPLGQMALVGAVAACEAARGWVPATGVKWPNDLILRDRKVGGILVEWPADADLVAVGIGINVARPPEAPLPSGLPAGALAPFVDARLTPEELLPVLLDALGRRWKEWQRGGWPRIHAAWSEMDVAVGRRVRVDPPGVEGRADGIDLHGALRIRRDDGACVTAAAGEVLFLGEP